jgi:hypothetical protein
MRARAAGSGVILLPSEKRCLTRLYPKALNCLLGQRSDDPANIAAIGAGRFQSQFGRVRQDNPEGPPVPNPLLG